MTVLIERLSNLFGKKKVSMDPIQILTVTDSCGVDVGDQAPGEDTRLLKFVIEKCHRCEGTLERIHIEIDRQMNGKVGMGGVGK
jgi:hypothetical protein